MKLRTEFLKPFPKANALFLSDEELDALKQLIRTSYFTQEPNLKIAASLGIELKAPYSELYRGHLG